MRSTTTKEIDLRTLPWAQDIKPAQGIKSSAHKTEQLSEAEESIIHEKLQTYENFIANRSKSDPLETANFIYELRQGLTDTLKKVLFERIRKCTLPEWLEWNRGHAVILHGVSTNLLIKQWNLISMKGVLLMKKK